VTEIHTVTYFEVAPGEADAVVTALAGWSSAARGHAGCSRLQALRRLDPRHHFVLIAGWRDQGAFEAARGGPLQTLLDRIGPVVISGVDTRVHAALIGGPHAGRRAGELHVVTHVDVPPPNKDACIALLGHQVDQARRQSGNAAYEVFQQADRPNHFTVVESWETPDAYRQHIVADHTREFRTKLTPLSGALYDERLYDAIG
jgi:quinol monooxygenase YgiN